MDSQTRQQIIAQEWMVDPKEPLPMLSRLQYRGTYADETLWWLVVQLNLLNRPHTNHYLKKLNIDPHKPL